MPDRDARPRGGNCARRHAPPQLDRRADVRVPADVTDHQPRPRPVAEPGAAADRCPDERDQRGDYENVSYRVLNIGNANLLHAYSAEIGVPVTGDVHVRAVEKCRDRRPAPAPRRRLPLLGVRAALRARVAGLHVDDERPRDDDDRADPAHPHRGRARGGRPRGGSRARGRPHWGGQHPDGQPRARAEHVSALRDWIAAHERFNSTGVFDSPFSKRRHRHVALRPRRG